MKEHPKYYLADVPHDLRRRVLDLCFKRLWHEALELLEQNGIHHYNRDDLMNFYSWAPTVLPDPCPDRGRGEAQPQRSEPAISVAAPAPQLTADDGRLTDAHLQPFDPSIQKSINPSDLLSDLRNLINRFVVLPDMAAETLALWIVHTYAFTLRQVTTYIGVVSPEKRCGKTTLLELLGSLAHEAVAAANISPSALFRVIEEARPTLIIDEADTFMQGRDEMAGILNAGYRKGNAYVVRVAEGKLRRKPEHSVGRASARAAVGESTINPPSSVPTNHSSSNPAEGLAGAPGLARYSCWCPKVMAAIGRLPDTLADRCIVITKQCSTTTHKRAFPLCVRGQRQR